MSRKRKKLDGRTLRTKAAYREQARLGKYDELPEFKALCLSKAGYDPQVARPCLTAYPTSPLAGILLQAAQAESKEWHAPLAPVKDDAAEGQGGGLTVNIAPWAAGEKPGIADLQLFIDYLRDNGCTVTVPHDWDARAAKPASMPVPPMDEARLEATRGRFALPKADKPEAQSPEEMPPSMRAADEYTRQNAHTWGKPPKIITGEGGDE